MAVPQPQRQPLIDAVGVFKEAWELFTRQWQAWVLIGLCSVFVSLLLFCTCIGWILLPAIHAGLYVAAFKQLRGQAPEVNDLFGAMKWFGPMLLLNIVVGFLVSLGMIFCILPGIVLAIWWMFAAPLVMTHNLGALDAMATSKAKVSQGFWDIVVLLVIIMAVNLVAGMIPFGGLVIGLPLQTLMIAIAHRDMFGLEGALPPVGRDPAPAFSQQPPQGMCCPKCNAVNAPGTRFCTACGQQIA